VSGWPKRCKLAHAFLWEYSDNRLQLAQYFLTQGAVTLVSTLCVMLVIETTSRLIVSCASLAFVLVRVIMCRVTVA
jgi:hypothetical protein